MSLKSTYHLLLSGFIKNSSLAENLWSDIQYHYTKFHRHYHTLTHLENLFHILESQKGLVEDWEMVQFAIFYHDIVYDVSRNDNEEQSATWAKRVMQSLNVESKRIERCKQHILATKSHSLSNDYDTNLFTDADLSILGADPETYSQYCSGIRKEYSIYTENLYNEGRAKVLRKFLEMPTIFKTEPFQNQYENNARSNLSNELKLLTGSQE